MINPETMSVSAAIQINDRIITDDEINREMQHHPAPNPDEARRQAAVALSVRELLLVEAERVGIPQDPAAEEGTSADESRIARLLEQEINCPQPSEPECRVWYDKNRERFHSAARYEVSHILRPALADDAFARARSRNRCKRILRVLARDPARFAALARRHSLCPSAEHGGYLGTIGPGQTCTEFERALERLPAGEIAAHPLETRYGFHVVYLHVRDPGRPLTFEEVHERIASYLRESVWRRAVSQYVRILAGRAEIRGIDLEAAESPLIQ